MMAPGRFTHLAERYFPEAPALFSAFSRSRSENTDVVRHILAAC